MARTKKHIRADLAACETVITDAQHVKTGLLNELIEYPEYKKAKLFNLWRGTFVSLIREPSIEFLFRFDHIDGNIAYCYGIDDERVCLTPLQEVYVWDFGREVEVRA